MSVDAYLTGLGDLFDRTFGARYRILECMRRDAVGSLMHYRLTGHERDGGRFEIEAYTLHAVRDGVRRLELFSADHRDEAVAVFDEARTGAPK